MKKGAKLAIAAVVVAAIAGGAVAVQKQQGNKAVEVRIEPVASRDLVASVTASGQVRPRTKVDLSADITGRVVRLAVQEGDVVTKGQFLLQIDPQQFEATLQRSLAALASAKAQLAQARANALQATRNYERSRDIKRQTPTLISDEQLEQLKTAAEVNKALEEAARYSVEQAEAAVRDARWSLSRTTIVAPMSGKVTRLNVEAGETAIMGTLNKDAATLLTIADVSVYETKIKVDETDVSRIKLGDSAVVEIDAFPDTTFAGRVVRVSNSSVRAAGAAQTATDQAVDYEVTVQLLNAPPETRPDFSATARIITDVRTNVLSVPIIALTVREEERVGAGDSAQGPAGKRPSREVGKKETEGVFIVKSDNTVAFRPVKVGIAGERYFEVLGGVSAGERIVAGTYQAIRDLRDGARVRASAADSAKSTVAKAGDKK